MNLRKKNPAENWNTVLDFIKKVKMMMEEGTEEQISTEDRMSAYSAIWDLSFNNYLRQERLYDKYKTTFVNYIKSKVVPSLREKHDELFLRELVRRWPKRKIMVKLLSRVFEPLEGYVERTSNPSLEQVGGACFRDLVYQEFRSKAADAIIGLIGQEREGGVLVDRALLKNAVDVFLEMNSYESDFERAMLDDTEAYYSRKASEWIVQDTCSVYMLKAEECLEKEKAWVSDCLHSCSETKLLDRVRKKLLVVPLNQFLENENSGWRALIREDKVEDLSRMYRLFQQIPQGLRHVPDIHLKHVLSEDMVLVKQAKDAINKNDKKITAGPQELELVNKLINSQDKYLSYLSGFSNNNLVHQVLRRAFVSFCNKDISGFSSAEILASYWDDMLKKVGAGELNDEGIDEKLDNLVNLLAYICIDDRDVFAEFYRKKLAYRLLLKKGDIELEKTILRKLKQQFGDHFTSKMEVMVTDMTLAKENQNKSKEFLNGANLGMEFNVTVLTTRCWPINKSSGLNLPAEMAKCVETFKEYYKSVEETRRLTWIYSLGTCNINAKFGHNTVELIVSTYQAAVLLLFNTADKICYSEIKDQSNLGHEDLIRVLHSLSCAQYKILNKVANTKSVSVHDDFVFNSEFTATKRRIKIAMPSVDEWKKVGEVVGVDRRHSIDAAIVRIMKSRTLLRYQELVKECVDQLRLQFKPDVKLIKKRIEDLIERNYLERDKDNPNMFRYLA